MQFTTPHNGMHSILGKSPDEMDSGLRRSDRYLLLSIISLMVFGVLAVYSSIAYFAEAKNSTAFDMVFRHISKLGIAFFMMLLVSKINYKFLIKFSRAAVLVSWLLLILVMMFGTETFGARRWLDIGIMTFQPSSVAVVALLVHVSVMLSQKQEYIKDFKRSFLPILIWVGITCLLIGLEDFSSAGVLFVVCIIVMYVGRISIVQLGLFVVAGLFFGSVLLMQSEVRQNRVEQYIQQISEIESDEFILGGGYQAQQAHIAIARGGIFGVGIGKSVQRDFLPAPYNDFIFAIIAEEYGLIGSFLLIFIFTLILFRGIVVIAKNAADTTGALLATACTIGIVIYGFINAGVATGLLPVTGLPMPFVSYGGTSMLFTGIMAGILLNISKHRNDRKAVFYA